MRSNKHLNTQPFFPAGMILNYRNVNIEEMEYRARYWNLERIQMQKGSFRGSMVATHTPRIQLMRSPYSHGVLLKGDFPKGTILIAFVVTNSDVVFQNRLADKHEIKILKSGDEIDFLSNNQSETFTLAIEERFFYASYNAYFDQDFSLHQKDKRIYIHPQLFSCFVKGIVNWIDYLMQNHRQVNSDYERIESEILRDIFACIGVENDRKTRAKFQVQKARDLLHRSLDEPIGIEKMAQELGISERLLHHAFKATYGFTPKRYYLSLRMHLIRQELLYADPAKKSVTEIILKYNFFNLSTFCEAYKGMFGELPSETLQRKI